MQKYYITDLMHDLGETQYYAAIDAEADTPITLRVIDTSRQGAVGIGLEHLAADKLRRKMENEAKLLDKLDHPGLLKPLDVGFDPPYYYHVYAPFKFVNLRMRGRMSLDELRPIAVDAAKTLHYLHELNVVHCDVSAETLLLVDHQVKLIEFTIANHDQFESVAPGNPPYMSPEAVMGAPLAPARDAWGLGVTLYYVLSGELPFGDIELPREVGAPRLFQKIMTQSPPPLTDVPDAWIALIDDLLEKDPAKRLTLPVLIQRLEAMT